MCAVLAANSEDCAQVPTLLIMIPDHTGVYYEWIRGTPRRAHNTTYHAWLCLPVFKPSLHQPALARFSIRLVSQERSIPICVEAMNSATVAAAIGLQQNNYLTGASIHIHDLLV